MQSYLKFPDDGSSITCDKQFVDVVDDHFVHAARTICCFDGVGEFLACMDIPEDSFL